MKGKLEIVTPAAECSQVGMGQLQAIKLLVGLGSGGM